MEAVVVLGRGRRRRRGRRGEMEGSKWLAGWGLFAQAYIIDDTCIHTYEWEWARRFRAGFKLIGCRRKGYVSLDDICFALHLF